MPMCEIKTGITPADLAAGLGGIDALRQILLPNIANLTPDERKKFQKLGYSSQAFADIIISMATQHSATIPVDIDFGLVQTVYNYCKDLLTLKNNKLDVDELIDDLIMITGIQLMGWFNRIYSNAKDIARRSNFPFNEMVAEAGTRYVRSARTAGTNFSINAAVEITIKHVVPGSRFANQGTTVLKFSCGPDLSGKVKHLEPFTVATGNSVKVPKGYTTIVVANMSADTTGSFSVRINS
jgi:hypothetical protein